MRYAQIQNGFIVNVILLDDESLLPLFMINPIDKTQFDFVVRVDQLSREPQIGWSYLPPVYPNPATFTNPNPPDDGE